MSHQADDDAHLVRQSQKGDRAAFDSLVRRYEKQAYSYALRLTNNGDEAGDIVVDAFLRVYNALPNFKGQSTFGTWLYRIITNCYLDLRKKSKRHQHMSLDSTIAVEEGELALQVADPAPGPGEGAEKGAREQAVRLAMNRMPEYQQAMITMYHVEGLSYEEIAEALDLPIGTVKSRLNRARLALRELLAGHEELFRVG